eukprot:GHVL01033702.1.p1 GENE.GHVL01033702.1~~GHVL01033702.1.p1  ORF type:complete len:492 (+),score=99.19 GHVL01033702.1:690-2165(+)
MSSAVIALSPSAHNNSTLNEISESHVSEDCLKEQPRGTRASTASQYDPINPQNQRASTSSQYDPFRQYTQPSGDQRASEMDSKTQGTGGGDEVENNHPILQEKTCQRASTESYFDSRANDTKETPLKKPHMCFNTANNFNNLEPPSCRAATTSHGAPNRTANRNSAQRASTASQYDGLRFSARRTSTSLKHDIQEKQQVQRASTGSQHLHPSCRNMGSFIDEIDCKTLQSWNGHDLLKEYLKQPGQKKSDNCDESKLVTPQNLNYSWRSLENNDSLKKCEVNESESLQSIPDSILQNEDRCVREEDEESNKAQRSASARSYSKRDSDERGHRAISEETWDNENILNTVWKRGTAFKRTEDASVVMYASTILFEDPRKPTEATKSIKIKKSVLNTRENIVTRLYLPSEYVEEKQQQKTPFLDLCLTKEAIVQDLIEVTRSRITIPSKVGKIYLKTHAYGDNMLMAPNESLKKVISEWKDVADPRWPRFLFLL